MPIVATIQQAPNVIHLQVTPVEEATTTGVIGSEINDSVEQVVAVQDSVVQVTVITDVVECVSST